MVARYIRCCPADSSQQPQPQAVSTVLQANPAAIQAGTVILAA